MEHIMEFVVTNKVPLCIGLTLVVVKLLWDNRSDCMNNKAKPSKKNQVNKSCTVTSLATPLSLSRAGFHGRAMHNVKKNRSY